MNKSNIKEANEHLQQLHLRVQDLEATVQEQAEALMQRDREGQAALAALAATKDRELAALRRSLEAAEGRSRGLQAALRQREGQLALLGRRSRLLEEVCQELPSLEIVVAALRRTPSLVAPNVDGSPRGEASNFAAPPYPSSPVNNNDGGHGDFPSPRTGGGLLCSPLGTLEGSISRNFSISDEDDGEGQLL